MELTNEALWNQAKEKNQDAYGSCVARYAEAWANLMEQRMRDGETIEQMAKESSHQADTEGITGFMYGCAVSILAAVWKHGEELRRWHNKDTQIGDEGDRANESGAVLNPAVVQIG